MLRPAADRRGARLEAVATEADIARALAALTARDPRLVAVIAAAGPVPLRRRSGGFEGLAGIVTGQQISNAAADAIWARLTASVDPFTPEAFLAAGQEALRQAGLSRAKVATLTGVALACRGGLEIEALARRPPEEAIAALTALKGIGPWTAELYLLFCLGHPDIFPAGDLALQAAVGDAFALERRPDEKALRAIAAAWAPWRGVAARLFWAYYRARRSAAKGV